MLELSVFICHVLNVYIFLNTKIPTFFGAVNTSTGKLKKQILSILPRYAAYICPE